MTYQEVYSKLFALCVDVFSRHPVTEKKAADKLKFYLAAPRFDAVEPDIKDQVATELLSRLVAMELIGDMAYVSSYIASNNQSATPDGSLLVSNKLLIKGITQETLVQYTEALLEAEVSNAKKVLTKKFGDPTLVEDKDKKLKYLYQRGFRVAQVMYGLEEA